MLLCVLVLTDSYKHANAAFTYLPQLSLQVLGNQQVIDSIYDHQKLELTWLRPC